MSYDPLLRPETAAALLGVTPRTLAAWEADGLIHAERTAGGHRRYRCSVVLALQAKQATP
jgi:excisionase family DNA binding protein